MDQLTFDARSLEADEPRTLIEGAYKWVSANREAWSAFVAMCRASSRRSGDAEVKFAIEYMRRSVHIDNDPRLPKLPNGYSPVFGRFLCAWYPQEFTPRTRDEYDRVIGNVSLKHSKVDGCQIPPCPTWAVGL